MKQGIDKRDTLCYNTIMDSTILRLRLKAVTDPGFHVSLRQVARESGVTVSTISRFLTGKPILSDNLDALSKWYEDYEETLSIRV